MVNHMRFTNIRDEETNTIIYNAGPYYMCCIKAARPLQNNLRGWYMLLCAVQRSRFDPISQLDNARLTSISQSNTLWVFPFCISVPIHGINRSSIPSHVMSMTHEDEVTGEPTLQHRDLVDLGAVNLSPGEYTLRTSDLHGIPLLEAANLELHLTYPVDHPVFYTHSLAYTWMNMTPQLNTQVAA